MWDNKKTNTIENGNLNLLFSDQHFKTAIDQSPTATSIYNILGKLVYFNQAFSCLWLIEDSKIKQYKNNYNLFKDAEFSNDIIQIRKIFEFGKPWKKSPNKIIRSDSEEDDLYVSSTFFALEKENGKIEEIVLIQEDITPLLKTNAALRKNIKEISILKDALDVSNIIIEVDRNGMLLRANNHFCNISGYSECEINSISIFQMRSGNMPDSIYRDLKNTIKKGGTWKGEMENRSKKGTIYWTETTIVPLKNASGSAQSYLEISSNITERKKAELEIIDLNSKLEQEVLKRNEDIRNAISELEAFTYSVSHDLRAPLRAITGFSELLNEEFGEELNEEAKRYLEIIQSGTDQMAQLIDDLLQFSRVSRIELKKKMFDPIPIIQEIINKTKINAALNSEIAVSSLPQIYGDPNTITLVFTNLILNAIKFSRQAEKPQITIGYKESGEEVICFVKDNGVGFDMRYSNKLFKVFQRLHSTQQFEGTGVGLAIVHRIIVKHGGRVWGESLPGAETSFYFTLPHKKKDV